MQFVRSNLFAETSGAGQGIEEVSAVALAAAAAAAAAAALSRRSRGRAASSNLHTCADDQLANI